MMSMPALNASHDQNSMLHLIPIFVDQINAMVVLKMPLASHDQNSHVVSLILINLM